MQKTGKQIMVSIMFSYHVLCPENITPSTYFRYSQKGAESQMKNWHKRLICVNICWVNEDAAASSQALWWMLSRGVTSGCGEVGSRWSRLHQLSGSVRSSQCGNCLKVLLFFFPFHSGVFNPYLKGCGCTFKCAPHFTLSMIKCWG